MSDMNMYKILGQFNNVDPKLTTVTEDDINEPVYESVDPRGSIIEAVKSLEEKYMGFKESIEEAAKPDFLDLDKDGDTEEPMKSAAKSAKDHEPAKPDSDAVAKRKRLQALKDKQEDERAEKGDDYKSATRFVKGRAYGGSAQKDDEDQDDLEESGLQYYTGKKKYGKEGMTALAQAGREGASEEELGRIKDKYKKEGVEFGDTVKNSEAKMNKVTVKEGKDAIRNHPIYTTKEAWDHYAEELAEQEMMEQSMMTPETVDVQQELDEIAALAGLPARMESTCESCGCAESACKCGTLEEAATRKDFRQVADLIKQIPDADKRKELAHHHSDIFKQQNPRFKHDVFCKACGVDECDYNMSAQPTAVIVGEDKCPTCDCAPCKCDEGMMEAEVEEGNEFTGALAAAKASGEKEFEVDGKRYTVKEDININVTANGEEDVVNLIRKLSGMPVVAVQVPQQIESEAPCGICGATPCGCEQEVTEDGPKEREIEHVNTPREDQAGADASFPNGTDLNRAKKSYSDKPYRGDNPMAVKEAIQDMLWEKYETMINDVKA